MFQNKLKKVIKKKIIKKPIKKKIIDPVKAKRIIKFKQGSLTYHLPLEPAKKIISFFPNTNVASLTNIPREKSLQIYKQLEKMHQKEYSALSKTIFELRHTMSQQSGQHFKLTNKIERMPFEDLMQIMIAVNLSKK